MKKTIVVLVLTTLCLCSLALPSFAGDPAIAILSEDLAVIRSALPGEKIVMRDTDFKEALGTPDIRAITVKSIPLSTEGTLILGGRRVSVGQIIKRKLLSSLIFIPASKDVKECKFMFTVDGITGDQEIPCIFKFTDKVNYAPSAKSSDSDVLAVWTQCDVPVFGKMPGSDPEGDVCEYILLSYPKHGTLGKVDKTSGAYRYTPDQGYTGKDRFSYVIRDEYGNYSKLSSVEIEVSKKLADVTYVDMAESPAENAAIVMCALGIMSGETVGDDLYFRPDGAVTRAEFVAMAMKARGIRADSTLTSSFFDDNDRIPASLVSYVATAQRLGIVNGTFSDGSLLFRPNDAIPGYEAAAILSALFGDESVNEKTSYSGVPVSARAGVSVMEKLGVLLPEDLSDPTSPLTREKAASYLFRCVRLAERDTAAK